MKERTFYVEIGSEFRVAKLYFLQYQINRGPKND